VNPPRVAHSGRLCLLVPGVIELQLSHCALSPVSTPRNHSPFSTNFTHSTCSRSPDHWLQLSVLNSEPESLYDWRFTSSQSFLAPRLLWLTTRASLPRSLFFFFQFNLYGRSPYETSSLTRDGFVSNEYGSPFSCVHIAHK
jgi:hypothetical protein